MLSALSLISYAITIVPRLPYSLSLPIQPETIVIIKIEVIRIVTSLTLAILTHHLRMYEWMLLI